MAFPRIRFHSLLVTACLLFSMALDAGQIAGPMATPKAPARWTNLEKSLNLVVESPDPLKAAESLGYRVHQQRIQVHIRCASTEAAGGVVALLEKEGAESILNRDSRIQAWVRPATLLLLNSVDGVIRVERPAYFTRPPADQFSGPKKNSDAGVLAGSKLTEGLAAMNGPKWHTAGFMGQGIKVGVIDSFAGYENLLGTELPPSSKVQFQKVGGGARDTSPHGTACAEIIYDIAPSLDRMYLMEVSSMLDVETAVSTLQSNGVKVISASIGFDAVTAMDGTGPLQTVLANFKNQGGLYVAAAGNERKKTFWGSYTDPDGDGFTSWSQSANNNINEIVLNDGGTVDYPANETIFLQLVWNQWSSPQTDLDLYLVVYDSTQSNWSIVARSEEYQTGQSSETPKETIQFTTTRSGRYAVVVNRSAGPSSVDMHLYFTQAYSDIKLQFATASMSLSYPGDDANVFTVAALDAKSPYGLESYSSAGPTAGPGGSISGGRRKPDIAGFANVSTASYTNPFNGTSSATPHVSGASLLAWSANPGWTAAQVRSFLEGRAIDVSPSGADNDTGYGRLTLGEPAATSSRTLTVSRAGTGSGTITSSPSGINCGSTCSATFSDGTSVTLSPVASGGSTFAGWSGACSGTGSCVVSMTSDRSVTATFNSSAAAQEMFLSQNRVAVSLTWRNQYNGATGVGTPVQQMDQYGYFWFDSPGNPEVFIKVLDFGGTSYLVFHSALSDLEYTVNFRVVRTGLVYTSNRPPGSVCGLADGDTVKK